MEGRKEVRKVMKGVFWPENKTRKKCSYLCPRRKKKMKTLLLWHRAAKASCQAPLGSLTSDEEILTLVWKQLEEV